ncbi:phage tail protein I [Limisalsivibrio acetivorans]|uniref:phage tail protein I n=1 Tax=Limisalsivibrio acetivorans TaxID=1304888 RepID=UPI0003B76DCB|nr:phage tail protein I [Limisalsivibrio acetivorans]
MSKRHTEVSLLSLLPGSIRRDGRVSAAASAVERLLKQTGADISAVSIYPAIDSLSEEVLDYLAWQFNLSGPEGWSLALDVEPKRRLIKEAIELHRHKGTPYAVRRVLEILGLEGRIEEWFDYDGEPYTFRVHIDVSDRPYTEELDAKLDELITALKNVRSWYTVLVYVTSRSSAFFGSALIGGEAVTVWPWIAAGKSVQSPLYFGAEFISTETTAVYPPGG